MNLIKVKASSYGWDVINSDTGQLYLANVPAYRANSYIEEALSHDPERCQSNYPPEGVMDELSEEL